MVIAIVGLSGPAVGMSASAAHGETDLTAVYDGREIPLAEVHRHHCHDLDSPLIQCFDTALDRDLDVSANPDVGPLSTSSVFYVTFFEHASYGGLSYTASQPISSLVPFGWNDAVSSFKSLNAQRPKWWRDANYLGTSWQWPAGAWVSYVGDDANDRFSSLKNVP